MMMGLWFSQLLHSGALALARSTIPCTPLPDFQAHERYQHTCQLDNFTAQRAVATAQETEFPLRARSHALNL